MNVASKRNFFIPAIVSKNCGLKGISENKYI